MVNIFCPTELEMSSYFDLTRNKASLGKCDNVLTLPLEAAFPFNTCALPIGRVQMLGRDRSDARLESHGRLEHFCCKKSSQHSLLWPSLLLLDKNWQGCWVSLTAGSLAPVRLNRIRLIMKRQTNYLTGFQCQALLRLFRRRHNEHFHHLITRITSF